MRPCFNQITAGRQPPADPARDLAALAEAGWPAIELWLRHWDSYFAGHSPAQARRLLDDAGLVAAGACGHSGFFFAAGEALRQSLDQLTQRLEQCQALGAPHLVVTPGQAPERPAAADLDLAAEHLQAACDQAAGYGVTLGIEFLKGARLVNNLLTAALLATKVDRPNVGVVVDTFHLYAGISKVEDLSFLSRPGSATLGSAPPGGSSQARITFVHVNDASLAKPRELLADPDRVLPGEGVFPLSDIFAALRQRGYDGDVSLELFNEVFAARWAENPAAAARAALQSLGRLVPEGAIPR